MQRKEISRMLHLLSVILFLGVMITIFVTTVFSAGIDDVSITISDEILLLWPDDEYVPLSASASNGEELIWTSNDFLIASYDAGLGGVVAEGIPGFVQITARLKSNNKISATCVVVVLDEPSVFNGSYFLKNVYSNRFLTANSTSSITQNNIEEMKQQWLIQPTDDGYYNIQNTSNNAYLAISRVTYPPTIKMSNNPDNMLSKWRIAWVEGKYIICPKYIGSKDYILSIDNSDNISGGNIILAHISDYFAYSDSLQHLRWYINSATNYLGIHEHWNSDVSTAFYYSGEIRAYSFYWETTDALNSICRNNFYQGYNSAKSQWNDALDINIISDSLSSDTDIVIFGVTEEQYYNMTGEYWPDSRLGVTQYANIISRGYMIDQNNNKMYQIGEAQGTAMIYVVADEISASATNTIVHEMGHALGYQGHSQTLDDIMAPAIAASSNNIPTILTQNDIDHLSCIYEVFN